MVIEMDRDGMRMLLKENQEAMRKDGPEYCLDCVVQEALTEILAGWEKAGALFQCYLKQEEAERLDYYIYCYEWGRVMASKKNGPVTLDSYPKVPERKANSEQLDQFAKEQGGQLRRLWRRYQTVSWKRRVYESAYMTVLGIDDEEK